MKNKLTSPLQDLINQAAKLPPKTGEVATFIKRFHSQTTNNIVILCDTSASMSEVVLYPKRKIDILRESLSRVLVSLRTQPILISFDSIVEQIEDISFLKTASGSTALDQALRLAKTFNPSKTIVISDGQPNSEDSALDAADQLSGIIDVIYCGCESDTRAINFMHRLAVRGGGKATVTSWRQNQVRPEISQTIRKLLTGGSE